MVAAEWIIALRLVVCRRQGPKVAWLLAVLQNHFLIKVPKSRSSDIRRTPPAPCGCPLTKASTSSSRVVERKRSACGGRNAKALHHRLRAVVPGADSDALLVQDRPDVVRMDPFEHEGKHRRLFLRRADQANTGQRLKSRSVA